MSTFRYCFIFTDGATIFCPLYFEVKKLFQQFRPSWQSSIILNTRYPYILFLHTRSNKSDMINIEHQNDTYLKVCSECIYMDTLKFVCIKFNLVHSSLFPEGLYEVQTSFNIIVLFKVELQFNLEVKQWVVQINA